MLPALFPEKENKKNHSIGWYVKIVLLVLFLIGVFISIVSNPGKNTTSSQTKISQTKIYSELGLSSEEAYAKIVDTLSKIDGFTKITGVKSLGTEEGIREYWIILEGYYSEFADSYVKGDCFWLGFKSKTDEIDGLYVNGEPVYENGKVLNSIKKYTLVSSNDLDVSFYVIEKIFKQLANDPSSIELNINDVLYGKNNGVISVTGTVFGKNAFNATVKTRYEYKWDVLTNKYEIVIDGKKYTGTLTY